MREIDGAELRQWAGEDAWVRWGLADPLPGECWVHQDVAMIERFSPRWRSWWVTPVGVAEEAMATSAVASRVRSALTELHAGGHLHRRGSGSISVVRQHASIAHEVLPLGEGGDWDWLWTTREPPVDPREGGLAPLDDSLDQEEIEAFSRRHNPRVWTQVGTGRVYRWLGLRDEHGELIAVGGAEREDSGVDHLAGIVVAQQRRGQGLGRLITAALTRASVQRDGVCALGVFADNTPALALYADLGYRSE